ncbi:hypothetical protein [Moheibacter stercoris]|uniref:Uncharacterized protein n=1 Tax=Moheibacter stercoris TaxID=1628251 RepID=A0ABV2LRA8_9FLAO
MRHKANVLLEQIKTIKKLLVMKNVFVKGFALLAVVALSFANVSCEQKPAAEEAVEAAADATTEAAEATVEAAEATADAAGEAVVDGANTAVEAAADATVDAAQATEAAANEVKEEVAK